MSCTPHAQLSLGGDMQHTRSSREEKTFVGPRILFVHVFFAVRPSDLCDHRGGISMYMSCTTLAQQSLGGDMQHTRSMREEKTFVGPLAVRKSVGTNQ